MPNSYKIAITMLLALVLQGCTSTNGHRSTGEVIDDAGISTKIKTALLTDRTTDGLDIEIEIDEGRVQLNGFADSAEELKRAEEIARGTKGVVSVQNNLRVAENSRSVGRYIDDKVLVARVNGALAKDPEADAIDIEVEVNRGVVMLGGYVDTKAEVRAAEAAAKRVEGVEQVINNLQVR